MRGRSPAPPLPVHRQPPPSRVRVHDRAGHDPLRPVAADAGRDRGGRSVSVLCQPEAGQQCLPEGYAGLRLHRAGRLPAAAVLSVQAAPRLRGRRGGHLPGHGGQRPEPPAAGDAARLLLASHSRRAGALLPRGPALRPCAALRHAAGADHGHQRHALTAVLHRPRAAVPLDADGDAHRPSAGKGSSDGRRAHLPNAVPAGAARGAAAGSGRRFRLLDGRRRRHALFLGARPPHGTVSPAVAGECGHSGADGSKLAGRGCDRPPHAAGADGEAAGRVAAAGPVPLLSGVAFPPRLHGVRRLLSAHLSR